MLALVRVLVIAIVIGFIGPIRNDCEHEHRFSEHEHEKIESPRTAGEVRVRVPQGNLPQTTSTRVGTISACVISRASPVISKLPCARMSAQEAPTMTAIVPGSTIRRMRAA